MQAQFMSCDFQEEVDYWNQKAEDWKDIARLATLKLHIYLKELKLSLGGLIDAE
jgi:hypothetical protein